jgi:hypothetical protein
MARGVVLTPPPRQWECPHCWDRAVTPWDVPNRFHDCPALAGITAPMVPAGSGARVRTVEWDDYTGNRDVQHDDNGRPIAAVYTDRPDGSNDCIVLPSTAHGRMGVS